MMNVPHKDKLRMDFLERVGRWADVGKFLIESEEAWDDENLRRAIDKLMERERELGEHY